MKHLVEQEVTMVTGTMNACGMTQKYYSLTAME